MSSTGSDTLDNYPSLDGPLSSRYDPGLGSKGRPKPRRGGFGDAGTMGVNGELPVAPVVTVASERQLADELATAAAGLDMSQSWEQRVHAMLRIEGLVKGGAATAPSFPDLLPSLQIPLADQLQDRRSAISRQACHLISTLVQAVGTRAEPLAAGLLPIVFKAQGMSIQVVSEASDACLRNMIHYCPSSRYLGVLCSTIRTSKAPKMRTAAAEYFAQALREWDMGPLEKQVEAVEAAIMAAAADSGAETREIGRAAFVSYASRKPAAAAAMLRRLPDTERSLKEKLEKAVKRQLGDAVVNVSVAPSHSRKPSASSIGSQSPRRPAPGPGPGPARVPRLAISSLPSPRGAGPLSARGPAPVAPSAALPPRPASAAASPAKRSIFSSSTTATETSSLFARGPRKSMGGTALRVPPLGIPLSPEAPPRHAPPALSGPKRVLPSPTSMREESPRPSLRQSTLSPSVTERTKAAARVILMSPERPAVSLGAAVAALDRPGLAWDARVGLFGDLQAAIEGAPSLPADEDPYEFEANFAGLLTEGLGDPHFKVAGAAMEALAAALRCPLLTPALDAHMDRICPVLFLKLTDAKEQVRQVAGSAAELLPEVFPPESVSRGLASALAASKAPKVMCAVMDFFADMTIAFTRRGGEVADSGPLRSMVAGCTPLATHKHPEVRQSALGALAAVYFGGDVGAEVVRCCIDALPSESSEAVKRGIAAIGGGAELVREMTPMRSPSPAVSMRSPSPVPMRSASPAPGSAAARRRESITMSADTVAAAVDLLMPRELTPMAVSPSPPPAAVVRTPTPPPSAGPRPSPSPSPLAPLVVEVPEQGYISKDDNSSSGSKSNGSSGTPKTVSIVVDATGLPLVQCTQPWSAAPVPADTHDLEAVLAGLHPLPTEAALTEALALAARFTGAERQILCDGVQSAVLAALEKGVDADTAEVAMRIFAEVVALMTPEALEATASTLLRPLALAQSHPSEGTAFAAEKLGKAMLTGLSPVAGISMLAPLLPRADKRPPFEGERAAQSLGVLRLLRFSLPKLSNVQVSGVLPTIVPPMCVCYTSANAELRRAAVDCIVDLHLKLGAASLAPHTGLLSSAQVKLIEIYVERAQRGRAPADTLAF